MVFQIFQEGGRRALWSVNGPRILQIGYEDEENPKVMEAYERVGSLVLLFDLLLFSLMFSILICIFMHKLDINFLLV